MNDHSNVSGADVTCADVEVNKCCFEAEIKLGTPRGQWRPPHNDCNTVMRDALFKCGANKSWNKIVNEREMQQMIEMLREMGPLLEDAMGAWRNSGIMN
jgi:hypothetical protein